MKIIDLTHPISADIPVYFPWHPATELRETANYADHLCVVRRLSIGTHTGTHIDAPSHMFKEMFTIDKYNPDLWFVEAQVLDMTPRGEKQAITVAELREKEIAESIGVILKTGWDVRFGRSDYYETYPPLSNEAAEYLLEKRISLLAADTPFTLDVHRIMLSRGIPLVTNINNTGELTEGRLRLISAPLLIKGGDGAPARVLALL